MTKKWVNLFLKIMAWLSGSYALYVVVVLAHGTFTDYQPENEIPLIPLNISEQTLLEDSILSFTIWNIGYGGLGAESEMFFDSKGSLFSGGKMIRTPKKLVERNVQAVCDLVTSIKSDFFLFQEIDLDSKRSYYVDQVALVQEKIPDFSSFFAPNYKVARVPIPVFEPWHVYGKTHSGLATFASFQPAASSRNSLPGSFSWPTRIFQLDRCAALHRFKHSNGKELVVINVHLSAYDRDGALKKIQMEYLKTLVLEEYEKGHYVIVGGDWNQCPPFFKFDTFMPGKTQGYTQLNINPEFLPTGWRWVYDPAMPTNRKTKAPYQNGETFVTLIDFFLISPNIRVLNVKGLNQDFQYSDHQPVWMEITLE